MTPIYILLLLHLMKYASSEEHLVESGYPLSDVSEATSVELRATPEASGGRNEITGTHSFELASEPPKSKRYNLAKIRSSVHNADLGGVNDEVHTHKLARGDTDGALNELNDPQRLSSLKISPQRRFYYPYGFFPFEWSRSDDNLESELEDRRPAERRHLNQYLSPYYRALLNFADIWSRSAQDAEGSKDKLDVQRKSVESLYDAGDSEGTKGNAINEANSRLGNLLREATSNVANSKDSSRISSRRSYTNGNKPYRRSYDGNAHYNRLLSDAINKLASITESNKYGRRSGTSSVNVGDADARLNALNEVALRLSQLQQDADNSLASVNEGNKSGRRSNDPGMRAYENALNNALKKLAKINEDNKLAWAGSGRRKNQDYGIRAPNSQDDLTGTSRLVANTRLVESDASSGRSCAEEARESEDEANINSRRGSAGLNSLQKRSIERFRKMY